MGPCRGRSPARRAETSAIEEAVPIEHAMVVGPEWQLAVLAVVSLRVDPEEEILPGADADREFVLGSLRDGREDHVDMARDQFGRFRAGHIG